MSLNDLLSRLKNEHDLLKAMDKSKLVQRQVTVQGKNGPFLRMQWMTPEDAKKFDAKKGNRKQLVKPLKETDKEEMEKEKEELTRLIKEIGRAIKKIC